jgi:hypothetical protein
VGPTTPRDDRAEKRERERDRERWYGRMWICLACRCFILFIIGDDLALLNLGRYVLGTLAVGQYASAHSRLAVNNFITIQYIQ